MSDPAEDFVMVDAPDADLSDSPNKSPSPLADLRCWLQPTRYLNDSSEFKKHLSAHVPGTGRWLFEASDYQQWHDSPTHGALWIKAVAGAGKSVLAAHLISELRAHQDRTPVLFFFFRQIVTANDGCQSLVRDWIHQLLEFAAELAKRLEVVKNKNADVESVAFSELWQILLDALGTMEKVYCVVDALDELDNDEKDDFIRCLVALGQMRPGAVKLIMTSRPLPQIQKILNEPSILQVRLEDRQINQDIEIFVEHRLLQASHLSVSVKEKIKCLIDDRAHPSFLYARLMLNDLLKKDRVESLGVDMAQKALLSLPASLEDLYTHMLHDHAQMASVPQERQMLILQLATHAFRPLRLLEISTVLNFLDMDDGEKRHGDTKNMTRMSCGPLLEILDDETVCIIHHSFTEYLTDMQRKNRMLALDIGPTFPVIQSEETHELIALICVRYLLSGCLSSWTMQSREQRRMRTMSVAVEQKERQSQHPFLAYALHNWTFHIRHLSEVKGQLLEALDQLMQPKTNAFLSCADYMLQPNYDLETITPLHLAAWGGLTNYMKMRLMSSPNLDVMSEIGETPLGIAAQKGHSDTVCLLLNCGASPDIPDTRGMKPLHYAAQSNHHATVQVLVDVGVSPMTPRTKDFSLSEFCVEFSGVGDTPLKYASESGGVESIAAMLPLLSQENLNSSLIWAITRGQVPVVQYVLETDFFDINSNIGGKALIEAGSELSFEILQLLLNQGADPTYQQQPLRGAPTTIMGDEPTIERASLILAVCGSPHVNSRTHSRLFERCLDLALSVGCDVNVPGEEGYTALHYCIKKGIPGTEKLLQHGARVDARDNQGNAPLHLLRLFPTSERAAEALIRYGARWDSARDRDGKTALLTCLENFQNRGGNIEWMKPYVDNWNISDREGNTLLHVVGGRDGPLTQQLIGMGVDINSKNKQGETPLHKINVGFYEISEGGKVLLAAGADIEARDNNGRTWFLRHVMQAFHKESLQVMLDLGVNRHTADYEGNNALHLVCQQSRKAEILRFLLDAGLDPLHRNHMGNTLYDILFRYGIRHPYYSIKDVFDLLRGAAISLRVKNNKGETLLHLVCSKYHNSEVADYLPEADIIAMLTMSDNEGRTPLHNAVGNCEEMAEWAIKRAPHLTMLTHKKQNLLHMAAEAKRSNVIGLLLESYSKDQRDGVLNQVDREGCTPLHYACRSGRPESVQLLLDVGADVRKVDMNGYTPLHACTMFIRRSDDPNADKYSDYYLNSDQKTLRVADIVHLLCRHGADLSAKTNTGKIPIQLPVDNNISEMVCALDTEMEDAAVRSPSEADLYRDVSVKPYLLSHQTNTDSLVKELSQTKRPQKLYDRILWSADNRALDELAARGTELTEENYNWRELLRDLAWWGYSDLLGRLLKREKNTDWINGSLKLPGNWHEATNPLLFYVASRELPSLSLLRLLVETFKANVNVRSSAKGEFSEPTILHIMGQGNHWWQTEAVRYVLSQGADVTVRNKYGCTPLHVTMNAKTRRIGILKALLEHGADPNAMNNDGNTPFNLATADHELLRLFLSYGADITTVKAPMLLNAIQNIDVELVQTILMAGVDCNLPFKQKRARQSAPKAHIKRMDKEDAEKHHSLWMPPIWVAARIHFPNPEDIRKHEKTMKIVQVLLEHGANPFKRLNDTTVLHNLIDYGGTLAPLLELPDLNLEQRDTRGRTLLLAACGGQDPDDLPFNRCLGNYRIGLIRQLCAMGANVSAIDNKRQNVLHLLVTAMKDPEDQVALTGLIKELIIQRPQLLEEHDGDGYTPVLLAAAKKRVPTTVALADVGANLQERDPDGNTPLHHLASYLCSLSDGDHGYAYKLMRLKLDFNARNHNGDTPLSKYILSFNDQPVTIFGDICVDGIMGPTFTP